MAELDPRQLEPLHARLAAWAALWETPLLAKSVGLRASSRMRRSLGSYRASSHQITIAAWLFDPSVRPLLDEVLCHEAAHAAVHLTYFGAGRSFELRSGAVHSREGKPSAGPLAKVRAGLSRLTRLSRLSERSRRDERSRRTEMARIRPHGPEWRAFMEAAGYAPRVRIPESAMPAALRVERAERKRWEHRCPVCQATRMARIRVTRWRCRRCVEAGRSGGLVIERVGVAGRVDA